MWRRSISCEFLSFNEDFLFNGELFNGELLVTTEDLFISGEIIFNGELFNGESFYGGSTRDFYEVDCGAYGC